MGRGDEYEYKLNSQILQKVTEEKDLGVFVTNDLKPSRHCQEARKKSLKMLGMLNRNVEYKSKIVIKSKFGSKYGEVFCSVVVVGGL